jgi:leucyl aminopeptidase
MRVSTTSGPANDTDADTIIYAITGTGGLPPAATELVESGEAKPERGHIAVTHDDGRRILLAGFGDTETCNRSVIHQVAAKVAGRLTELGSTHACWAAPAGIEPPLATSALVEGTVLASYRLTAYRSGTDETPPGVASLTLSGVPDELAVFAARAVTLSSAVNRARDLQNGPANVITPAFLAARAEAIAAAHDAVSCEVGNAQTLAELEMGAFAAVTQGTETPPALIVLRYEPPNAPPDSPLLAFVGKGVTFDSGGLSIKPASGMVTMKSDMSGGASVIEATAAIAELGFPIRLLTVVGATENGINGRALKPGDVVTAANSTTIEIDNTDAEGRLVLADCLHHAVQLGADQIIDLATLTGAMKVALGSQYCGYFATDDSLASDLEDAAREVAEPIWRMPLDDRYGELMKGTIADLTNAAIGKGGGACSAAAFLQRFVGDVPWAHFDLSTAYDAGLPWAAKGGSGPMVRTLVEYAQRCTV